MTTRRFPRPSDSATTRASSFACVAAISALPSPERTNGSSDLRTFAMRFMCVQRAAGKSASPSGLRCMSKYE